jgi:hypothetical protein
MKTIVLRSSITFILGKNAAFYEFAPHRLAHVPSAALGRVSGSSADTGD